MKQLSFLALAAIAAFAAASCHPRPQRLAIGIALNASNHAGVELAAREINERGGVNGVQIELVGLNWKVNTEFEAHEIISWANRFAETTDLVAVIGHSDSASTLSAAAVYNGQKVPQIVTIATNPAITNIGDWTYRLCLSDATQGVALARYAVNEWGKKRICVFYVNDAYGRGLADIFEHEVTRLGGAIIASRMHRNLLRDDDKSMIESALSELKNAARPDLFVLFQRTDAADWTTGTIRRLGFTSDILGGDSLGLPSFLTNNTDAKNGMRVSQFYSPAQDEAATRFVRSFREMTGSDPDYGHAYAYDAVYLVRDAVARFGFSREGVKKYLDHLIHDKTTIEGVAGRYLLAPDHDARRTLSIVEARGGTFFHLKSLPIQ